jgi:NADPH2:quinone reductase
MRVIQVADDRSLRWVEVPDPVIREDEILIDVHAAALNRADLLQRAGTYPPPPGWPAWMGLEVAGVVTAVGPQAGDRWRVGDHVCALLGGGGYAEKVAVPVGLVLPVPRGFSFVQAAALPEVFATAYLNLVWEANLQAGETILIHAGASGLGLAAIQIAKWRSAKVITTVSSNEKADAVRAVGADVIVNRHTDDLDQILDQHPVNVTLDCVGGANLGRYFAKMARGGRWILVATLGGTTTEIPLNSVLTRGLRLIGSTLRSRPPQAKVQLLAEPHEKIWPRLESGQMWPTIHATLPIEQAEQAHAILDRNQNIGKVVLIRPQ